jgi:hypothetical protein
MNKVEIMSIKYYKLISYVLFSMVLLNTSCTDSIVDNREGPPVTEGEELVPILLNLKGLFGNENGMPTYALTPGGEQAGTGLENEIKDVTVFVFNSSNVCEKILKVTSWPLDHKIGPELVKSGLKTFITVVNGDTVHLKSPYGTYTKGNEALVNYNVLRQTLTEEITAPPVAPFLMTGETTATLSINGPQTPNTVDLEVKRAVAKVKFHIVKSAKAAGHTITMKSITLKQGADKVYLLQQPSPSTVNHSVPSSAKTTFTPNDTVPNTGGGDCQLVDTFYTYESLAGLDKGKAVYFELEAAVNSPTNFKKARVYLAENPISGTSDTLYNVYRNYWYNVNVNITDPGMDSLYVTINACPWNVADAQTVYPGGGYEVVETAQPFKLVKNYTAAELAQHPEFAAIEKHSKGASWIKFKVTEGFAWNLDFTSGSEIADAKMSKDSGASWSSGLSGTGDDDTVQVYIYRPYVENAEPNSGPTFSLTVGGTKVRSFVVQPRDTTPVPTNCFIMRPKLTGVPFNETRAYIPLKGVYRYWEDYLLANGDTIPEGKVDAKLIWQDTLLNNAVVNTSTLKIINESNRDESYLYAEAGSVQGNAVVAMYVGTEIYWSFHLWVTEYNPYEAAGQKLWTASVENNIFMDRNLGALSNKYDSEGNARGLFYQFGRKDPFPRTRNWSNTAGLMGWDFTSGTGVQINSIPPLLNTPGGISTGDRPLQAIPFSLKHPTEFITVTSSWPLSVEDTCLWSTTGGNKTAFDPCPAGWRVPRQVDDGSSPWYGLNNGNLITVTGTNGRYYSLVGYYPFAGYLNGTNVIEMTGAGTSAYFWASWNNSTTEGMGLSIDGSSVNHAYSILKRNGVSVRCVVDRNYLINTGSGGLFGSSAGEMKNKIN